MRLQNALAPLERQLAEAQHVLETIKDPPVWGYGDHSPRQVEVMRQKAEKIVKELG
jgi:hypothetical protein